MIIGIISDTHGYFSPIINNYFKDVNLILHAGDIGSMTVINSLENISKVEAIKGNMDHDFIWNTFTDQKILEIKENKILLVHRLPYEYKKIAKEKNINIIVYGHTHSHEIIEENGVLLINPGSAGNKHGLNTAALLEIDNNIKSKAQIINLI